MTTADNHPLEELVKFIDDRLDAAERPNSAFAVQVGMSPSSFSQVMNKGQKTIGLTNLRKIATGLSNLTGEKITAEQLQALIDDPTPDDRPKVSPTEPEILRSSGVVWHLERMAIGERVKTLIRTTPMLVRDLEALSPVPMGEFPIARHGLMESLIARIHKLAKVAKTETIEEFADWIIKIHPEAKKNDLIQGLFEITALKTLPSQVAGSYDVLTVLGQVMGLKDDRELLDLCGLNPDRQKDRPTL
jgi:hypothetical protein